MAEKDLAPSASPDGTQSGLFRQFLSNQSKELEVKLKELEVQQAQGTNGLAYAREAMAAQERDRKDARRCERDKQNDRFKLVGAITIGLFVVIGLAMYLDKDALAIEIIKAIAYLSAGAWGGYSAGRLKGAKEASDQSSEP